MPRSEPYERLGGRRLALPDLIGQSAGFVGPVFSAAFAIPLVAGLLSASGQGGGRAAPLSVLIAAAGILAIGWVLSAYAREVPAAGSLYDYVSRGLGGRVGTAAGWLYYTGVTVLLAGLLLLIGGYLQAVIQAQFGVRPLPPWAWTLLVIALVAAAGYFGVRISARAQLALVVVSMVVVLAFFVTVIVKLGPANSLRPFHPAAAGARWPGIFFGVLYGVLLFVGFETAANLAEEAHSPRRAIPVAIMTTAGITAAFLILAAYVEVAGLHYRLSALTAAAGGPLFALGAPAADGGYGGLWTGRLLELAVLLDMLAVAVGCAAAASRGFFALARDRRIPAALAIVSRRRGTPVGALIFLIAVAVAALLVDELWSGLLALPQAPHYLALFAWGSTFGGFALVVTYLLACVGALHRLAAARHRIPLAIAAVVGIVITGGAIWASFDQVTKPLIYAPWVALAVLVIGFASTFVLPARQPASTRLADLTAGGPP
jgi:amino acid transporter